MVNILIPLSGDRTLTLFNKILRTDLFIGSGQNYIFRTSVQMTGLFRMTSELMMTFNNQPNFKLWA
jgi:hypothetical protein